MNLICLRCGEPGARVRLTMAEDHVFSCSDCEAEYSASEIRAQVAAWVKVLKWVETSPFRCEVPAPAEAS